jgi:type I restriction enzyme R subunit
MPADYSEDSLIEQPAIALFAQLGWQTANCFHERFGANGTLGRETAHDVVLRPRLRWALQVLNPGVAERVIELAVETLAQEWSALSPAQANREVYGLLKDGVPVSYRDDNGEEALQTVRVIDWQQPERNDFFLASQFWVAGDMYRRRADLVGFVNGLPLVLVELKAVHRRLEDAYTDSLRDYKAIIPQLFPYNAFIILSNGAESRVGTLTAAWEHFAEWKRVSGEDEAAAVSLETIIRGTCDKARLLDLVENFTLFREGQGALVKLLAKNHQYLGVNNAVRALETLPEQQGRLGVFWHTQGSGKSLSMVFFVQKTLRRLPGAWTFLIVTDRLELDDQIYKTFAEVGAVTERQVQATSGAHLQQLLRESHRTVFTLIQKFHAPPGVAYPPLSDRSDIIVITDEAHRSQYETLALNMRNALPNAAFIAFTGTPLLANEEPTRRVFGDYVSVYNFAQSVADGATVPLYYENHVPELQLTRNDLNAELEALIEEEGLDDSQQRRLEREFGREYHLITRDSRLERIAADLVEHFSRRGQFGKGLAVSIDKATAVRMYDKVRRLWGEKLATLRAAAARAVSPAEALQATIQFMETTDMAVVVSEAQNEVEDFRAEGLDIAPHRRRMLTEDLAAKFKDPANPLRLVFVCAMWITGFDVPSLATVYLDKPMRNHTLMQTIARANRVFEGKTNGLIVDYVGIFRDLQSALAIYGSHDGAAEPGDLPVQAKEQAVAALRATLDELDGFCRQRGVDIAAIIAAAGFSRLKLLEDAFDALVTNDQTQNAYLALAAEAARGYRAILPDPAANAFAPALACHAVLAARVLSVTPRPDISRVMAGIAQLLDAYITPEERRIAESPGVYSVATSTDLSAIDFGRLRAQFAEHRHVAAARLRAAIADQLQTMLQRNRSRLNYQERFQRLIDAYNAGTLSIDRFFTELVLLSRELETEAARAAHEGLSEEELAVVDLLRLPDLPLADGDDAALKQAAGDLLTRLKAETLTLDWRQRQQTRAQTLTVIRNVLDRALPPSYTPERYEQVCAAIYEHVYDAYGGPGRSVYGEVA